MENLFSKIPSDYVLFWIAMLCVVIYFLIKFLPKVLTALNSLRKHTNNLENLIESVDKHTKSIELTTQKIDRDYHRINDLERLQRLQNEFLRDFSNENEIILRSLLGVVQGLQEIGANGPTKKVESDIQDYLLKKACRTSQRFDEYSKYFNDLREKTE